ncbi:MAG: undecaprenyl/decaprenyl-phosphate alpha-N-acetylglucosaminyl 1-phosphate transferase [Planctomycetes bacterium]|nr:undecaprenyl/decaprenyl-phosphate alpha-N-acetylglucosaminyl 1-phosphate transferase [Planctomycetota bacterium]
MLAILAQQDLTEFSQDDIVFSSGEPQSIAVSAMDLLNSYALIFIVAFLVTLLCTPLVRRAAIAAGAVDKPDSGRKAHPYPVASLGGIAVFIGLIAAIATSYLQIEDIATSYRPLPIAIVLGMVAIMFTGLADDLWGWDPRLKIAGQLVAAAALAINDIGVRVAEGVLRPFMGSPDDVIITLGSLHLLNSHVFYWTGTVLIALFVLGGCNASNFIDGLDGLLSGVVAIVAVGLLAICLLLAPTANLAVDAQEAEAQVVAIEIQTNVYQYQQLNGLPPPNLDALTENQPHKNLPTAPLGWVITYDPDSGDVSAADKRNELARSNKQLVRASVQRYLSNNNDELPRDIDTLIEEGYLQEKPDMPVGYSLSYNPNTGVVSTPLNAGTLTGARIVLCMALLGVVLGFLPHNFSPASIFLGDSGSLLLGYLCVVVILMLGEQGQTHLVFAGLIVFSIPIMDAMLAIIRRWLAGISLSSADDQHIHHQLKRALGGVKRAVFAMYGIGVAFALVGVTLAALVLRTELRVRVIYAIALVLFGFIGLIAVKAARRQQIAASVSRSSSISSQDDAKPNN